MINFSPKSKLSKKPAKKARKTRSSVPIRPPGYFALTPEDIAEMNMFALAAAKSFVAADKREKAQARKSRK